MVVVPFQRMTYSAKGFAAPCGADFFKLGGTLDGYVDFAIPAGPTYQLSLGEARALLAALHGTINDIERNCLYDRDKLLMT